MLFFRFLDYVGPKGFIMTRLPLKKSQHVISQDKNLRNPCNQREEKFNRKKE